MTATAASHDTEPPATATFWPPQNCFLPDSPQGGARTKPSLPLNLQQIKVCPSRLIRLLPSRCDGSGGHLLTVRVETRQTLRSFSSFLLRQWHSQRHTGRVNAGGGPRVREAAVCSRAAPHRTVTRQTAWPTDLQTEEEGADGDLQTAALIWLKFGLLTSLIHFGLV